MGKAATLTLQGDVLTVQLVPVALGATPGQVEIEPEAIEVEFS